MKDPKRLNNSVNDSPPLVTCSFFRTDDYQYINSIHAFVFVKWKFQTHQANNH